MKTKYFFLAAAAALFAACSSDDGIAEQQQAKQQAEQVPVTFGAYVNRAITRAGAAETVTQATLTTGAHKDAGFGVFGYYTDNGDYTQYALPNFMYNQQVKYTAGDPTGTWGYSPIKYWPNEFGTNAASDDVDKVTFFAYAPWVKVTPTSGIPEGDVDKEKNITQITKNTATGDPIIKYVVDTDPKTSVDLLWGVVPGSGDASYAPVEGATAAPLEGYPYLDLVKAQTATTVKFNFQHALAKLNVQIDYDKDVEYNPHSASDDHSGEITNTETRIYVRSITFTGFAIKGALNLNNSSKDEPLWYDYDGTKEITASAVTYYDGRKDGKEATQNGEQKSEKPATLNPQIIQNEKCYVLDTEVRKFGTQATTGVTNVAQNLFANTKDPANAADPIFVIPTKDEMTVTIVYDVETIDPSLPTYLADGVTHGSSVENRITKESVFASIDPGKSYILKLHLGMTSVNFDAVVATWNEEDEDVDLPYNDNGTVPSPAPSPSPNPAKRR